MKKTSVFRKGFTLVEVLIAASILVGAVLAFLLLYYNMLVLVEKTKNVTIAVNDAQYILERIRDTTPFTNTNVTMNYPQGNDFVALVGPTKLQNETITIAYDNTAAVPLAMTVTVGWQEKSENRSITLKTAMAGR